MAEYDDENYKLSIGKFKNLNHSQDFIERFAQYLYYFKEPEIDSMTIKPD
mgnify:CR=1 FL=1